MKKRMLCIVMALLFTCTVTLASAFAAAPAPDASVQSTAVVSFTTKRISDTSARAVVNVQFTDRADNYVVTIMLQKKTSSGWATATDVSQHTIYYKGSNKSSVLTSDSWTVKKGAVYRVKCTSVDKYNDGASYSSSYYSDTF